MRGNQNYSGGRRGKVQRDQFLYCVCIADPWLSLKGSWGGLHLICTATKNAGGGSQVIWRARKDRDFSKRANRKLAAACSPSLDSLLSLEMDRKSFISHKLSSQINARHGHTQLCYATSLTPSSLYAPYLPSPHLFVIRLKRAIFQHEQQAMGQSRPRCRLHRNGQNSSDVMIH